MGVFVSRLGPGHTDALARLWRDANERGTSELGLPGFAASDPVLARPTAFGVGVFDGGALVSAAVALSARGDDGRSSRNVAGLAHISSVATDPARWGSGLATVSLRAILSQAMRRGYARCQLWVFEDNSRARQLYERAGFVRSARVPRRRDGGDEMMVHYLRELTAPAAVARPAARVVCLDDAGQVLLMRWRDPVDGHQVWEPPGGGAEPGETPLDTVRREWAEETGLPLPGFVGEPTTVARDVFWSGGRLVGEETFFLARAAAATPRPGGFTEPEIESYLGAAWVGREALVSLEADGDPIEPDMVPVLQRLNAWPG